MPYRFAPTDASIQDGMRRIALAQIVHATHTLDDETLESDVKVHAVRQRCKKLRALLRLVQPAFAGYEIEHAALRDVARPLAAWRDASVRIESYDMIVEAFAGRIDRGALAPIRQRLTLQRKVLLTEADLGAALGACRRKLQEIALRIPDWELDRDGFTALENGLRKTYRRARKAMARARENPSPERFHAWRRHCQQHGHHARLLQAIQPGAMKARAKAIRRLGERLGHYHDLAILESTLSGDPAAYGRPESVDVMLGLLRKRREKLAAQAFTDGTGLLADTPSVLVRHWKDRYIAWHAGAA